MIDLDKLGKEWQYGIDVGIGQGNGGNGMNGGNGSSSSFRLQDIDF